MDSKEKPRRQKPIDPAVADLFSTDRRARRQDQAADLPQDESAPLAAPTEQTQAAPVITPPARQDRPQLGTDTPPITAPAVPNPPPLPPARPAPPVAAEPPPTDQAQQQPRNRKKRKDATGKKADYHIDSSMVGVRLPDPVIDQIHRLADSEGISLNAWLVRLILAELNKYKSG